MSLDQPLRESIGSLLRFHEAYAAALTADLSPAQMVGVPGAGHENHPAWTIGHLVTAADMIAQDLGLDSDVPDGWADLFLRRGPADRRLPEVHAMYPARAALLAELTRQHDRAIAALSGVDTGRLATRAEAWKLSAYLPSNLDGLLFMAACHASMHLGQLAAWRRAMGLPAAMAGM